jgi:hypothetical protein
MKSMIRVLVLGLALLSGVQAFAYPGYGPGREVFLGDTWLTQRENDVDWIRVNDCRDGAWDRDLVAVRVEVRNVQAEIESLVVRFGNGERQPLYVRERFAPGTSSRWIDLDGGRRCIREIRVVGDAEGYGPRQARIAVYGWRVR